MFKVSLLTRDGAAIAFTAEPDETLLDAAERAQIYPPSSCRQGGCGACRVGVASGEALLETFSDAAMSAAEREAGDILLCRAHARSDLSLTAPFDQAAIGFAPTPARRATIVELGPAGSAAMRLVLRYDDDPEFGCAAQFVAGQFAELELPGESVTRAYSIACAPNWDGVLEFLIRLQPGGLFSSWLTERAAIGDALIVHGPKGQFTLDDASAAPRWFVAGGTGLAPALSMLRQMAEFGDARPCRLFFGVNRVDEFFALDAIEALRALLPQLAVTLCVWKADAAWTGLTGTPAQALAEAPQQPDVYVCGPPALIVATEAAAAAAGIAPERVFSERFAPA
ncbi:MAG: 2Fe-2S iron-sulfur cluster-binding protein [Methylocystis sp.]|uniref:2Fe-2S iron-sulfur cluster-binding protein n=1 Tax=Methylocystis sp. TaxID=1911079 RepID=UPI003DA404E9